MAQDHATAEGPSIDTPSPGIKSFEEFREFRACGTEIPHAGNRVC